MITLELVKEFDAQQSGNTGSWVKQYMPNYYSLDAKNKGRYGEQFFLSLFSDTDMKCNDNNADHDFVVNGLKLELKFSLASNQKGKGVYDKFTFNHIGLHKQWDYLVLVGVNPPVELAHVRRGHEYSEEVRAYCISKKDLKSQLDMLLTLNYISPQQGGKAGGNDDYMVTDYQKILKWDGIKRLDEII